MKRRDFVALLAGVVPTGAALARPVPETRRQTLARRFLVERQSPDGAWRSEVYGSFKSGVGLTPLVLWAAWPELGPVRRNAAVEWLLAQGEAAWRLFPVHNAGWLLALGGKDDRLRALAPPLEAHLRELQFSSAAGWDRGHRFHGGWSYAARKPQADAGVPIAAMQEANLSATVLAVAGLRQAGVAETDQALVEAKRFLASCQNWGTDGGSEFDDGGFFQMAHDPTRNKAGVAGTDAAGRTRMRSYSSATADGLRGLLMCGVAAGEARVAAAVRWLQRHDALDDVPDLRFYSFYARAEADRLLRRASKQSVAVPLEVRPDAAGAFANPAGEMRENDPLVATALAVLGWD